jgi:hypothetical protein
MNNIAIAAQHYSTIALNIVVTLCVANRSWKNTVFLSVSLGHHWYRGNRMAPPLLLSILPLYILYYNYTTATTSCMSATTAAATVAAATAATHYYPTYLAGLC